MTPALKAMVEAIAAEFERQENEAAPQDRVVWSQLADDGKTMSFGVEGGRIDLEKVARAGLAAISRSSIADNAFTWESRDPMASLEQSKRGVSFRQMIRAILGEKP